MSDEIEADEIEEIEGAEDIETEWKIDEARERRIFGEEEKDEIIP